ncbi:MAG: succinate dehydrogenase, cytochrome b556 subunit [Sandaracinobacteroides sp.]
MVVSRPLSPHLSIWKWRVHMATSIFHRVTGNALAFGGIVLFTWWIAAAATSPEAYDVFLTVASGPIGWIVWIGLSWVFFQHLMSGLRHLAMDSGWGYDLGVSKATAGWTFLGSVLLTAAFWAVILLGGN